MGQCLESDRLRVLQLHQKLEDSDSKVRSKDLKIGNYRKEHQAFKDLNPRVRGCESQTSSSFDHEVSFRPRTPLLRRSNHWFVEEHFFFGSVCQ